MLKGCTRRGELEQAAAWAAVWYISACGLSGQARLVGNIQHAGQTEERLRSQGPREYYYTRNSGVR